MRTGVEESAASKQKRLKNAKVGNLYTANEVLKERLLRLEETTALKETMWQNKLRDLEMKFDEKRRLEELSELLD